MGKVISKIKLKNYQDEIRAQIGLLKAEEVREIELEGLVDSGATMLALPEEVVEKLGLPIVRETTVEYANGEKERRGVAGVVRAEILGRFGLFEALVGRKGTKVLIGQVILEILDLIIDPKRGVLTPRPESPDMPLIEMYKVEVRGEKGSKDKPEEGGKSKKGIS